MCTDSIDMHGGQATNTFSCGPNQLDSILHYYYGHKLRSSISDQVLHRESEICLRADSGAQRRNIGDGRLFLFGPALLSRDSGKAFVIRIQELKAAPLVSFQVRAIRRVVRATMQTCVPRLQLPCRVKAVVVRCSKYQRAELSSRSGKLTPQALRRGKGPPTVLAAVCGGSRSPYPGSSRLGGARSRALIYLGEVRDRDKDITSIYSILNHESGLAEQYFSCLVCLLA